MASMLCAYGVNRSRRFTRRTARLIGAALLSAVVCLAVAACGSSAPKKINRIALERSIARSILVQHHLSTKVSCPANVSELSGGHFSCYALLQVGRYRVPVTQVNGRGDVSWHARQPIVLLNIVRVKKAIETSIVKQRKVRAKVTCPAQVLQAAGLRFTCLATTHGGRKVRAGSYPFRVTETDGAGHVAYIEG